MEEIERSKNAKLHVQKYQTGHIKNNKVGGPVERLF